MSENKESSRPWPADNDDRFTEEERKALRELIRDQAELREIVRSKMITKGVINFVGETAKYIAVLIGVVIAYKNLWVK